MAYHRSTPLRKLKSVPWTGIKYLQSIFLTEHLYPEYINNAKKSMLKKCLIFKECVRLEQILHKITQMANKLENVLYNIKHWRNTD